MTSSPQATKISLLQLTIAQFADDSITVQWIRPVKKKHPRQATVQNKNWNADGKASDNCDMPIIYFPFIKSESIEQESRHDLLSSKQR